MILLNKNNGGFLLMYNIYIFEKYKRKNKMQEILHEIQGLTPEQLLSKFSIELNPPIQIEVLLERIGISVIEQDFTEVERVSGFAIGDVWGATISSGNDIGIFYKKGDTREGIRLTLAHELAHCCLDYRSEEISHLELRIKQQEDDEKEDNANKFACRLLIPEKSLKEIHNKFIIPSLTVLANIFEVSTDMMKERLEYLKLPYYKDDGMR